jgi:hypothetical protein
VGGKERIEGRVTTATSVECRLPGRSHGNVTVEVSLNGADWGGDSVQFRYKGVCVMRSVVPSMGTEEGGTIVTVHGRGFKEGGAGRVFRLAGRITGVDRLVGNVAQSPAMP